MGKLYGSSAHQDWKNIYNSYVAHLEHFAHKPSSLEVLRQLRHSQSLIFDRHTIRHYISLFERQDDKFLVDLNPLNHLASYATLSDLTDQAPEAVFVAGLRPLITYLTSYAHERYIFLHGEKTQRSIMFPEPPPGDQTQEIEVFSNYFIDVIRKTKKLYQQHQPATIEDALKRFSQNRLNKPPPGGGEVSSRETVLIEALMLYMHTNLFLLLEKLLKINKTKAFIAFNATKIGKQNVFEKFLDEHSQLGVNLGRVSLDAHPGRIRESSGPVINKLFASELLRHEIFQLTEVISRYHAPRITSDLHKFLFPALPQISAEWFTFCREIDSQSTDFIPSV